MSKKVKISLVALLFLVVSVAILHWRAKQIMVELVKSNTSGLVDVTLGGLIIIPIENTIRVKNLTVTITDKNSGKHTEISVRSIFLDVASLLDFFKGGTLVIEKLNLAGGMITLPARSTTQNASTQPALDLGALIAKIKSDAIRFKIQELTFRDFNLTALSEDNRSTEIKHFNFTARQLNLNADSILKTKPLIEFSLPHQTILLPSGIDFAFDTLFFSTTDNSIQGEQMKLTTSDPTTGNQFLIQSKKIRLAHFDFESLYRKGIAIIDSIFLDQSVANIQWRQENTDDATTPTSLDSIMAFNIKHLTVHDLAASLTLSNNTVKNSYEIKNSSLTINNFWHKPDSAHKFSTRDFDLLVTQYSTFLSQQSTAISFDTVRIQKRSLILSNFKIASPHQPPLLQTDVFKLNEVDWYALLYEKKLVAQEVVVQSPTIITTIKSGQGSAPGPNGHVLLESLKEFLNVNIFALENATAHVKLQEQQADLRLQGGYATIHFNDLINSTNPSEVLKSVDKLSYNVLSINSPEVSGRIDKFKMEQGSVYSKNASIHAKEKLSLSIQDLKVQKISWNQLISEPTLSGLGWTSLEVAIQGNTNQPKFGSPKKFPTIAIDNLSGANTKIDYVANGLTFNTLLPSIKLTSFHLDTTFLFSGIDIKGHNGEFESSVNRASIGSFQLTDQGGALNEINFNRLATDSLSLRIDKMMIDADLPMLAQQNFSVNQLGFKNIKTSFSKHDSARQIKISLDNNLIVNQIRYHKKKLTIGSLTLDAEPMDVYFTNLSALLEEKATDTLRTNIRRVRKGIDTTLLHMDSDRAYRLRTPGAQKSPTAMHPFYSLKSERGGIRLSLGEITAMLDSTLQIDANVQALQLQDLLLSTDKLAAQIYTGSIDNVVLHSTHLKEPFEILRDNATTLAINNLKARIEAGGTLIQFNKMNYNPMKARGSFKDLEIRPVKDKQAFQEGNVYQVSYLSTRIDSLSINQWDVNRLLDDSVIQVSSLHVFETNLDIYRDKTLPFFAGKIKLLPTNALQKLGLKIRIDTILFNKGDIRYTEKSRITGKEGVLFFTNLTGRIRNIRNTDLGISDSLYIRASTRFLDSALVKLQVNESYADTLGGFLMTTQTSPFHTSILNPTLVPLVSVNFESGYIDTISMRAVGRKYLSLGSMKMFYHDLKVNFLDKNDTSRHSVKTELMKFAANNLVIKANNTNRIGKVYVERDRHRAVFQYWVKMILSGATTSVGVKSNKKQIKKYMKQLDQKKLPPIDQKLNDL